MTGIDWGGGPNWDLWRWVMSRPNPYTGEDAWQRMQREAAGEPLPRLTTPAERAAPDRNPDPYTGAMFRAEHPGLTPGQTCPSCEDEDSSIADDGVCYLCVCGCSYCEPDDA
ncbi:hypothetical protein PP512_gp33 [Gordonia phage Denise]|uniref:Uncharacterized protein n=1 Tax=Gordonia phage Denise TaxID=2652879 RepID=A0A5P8DE47_9CAUD|nr:hypothetical protein PP512_gp33 [Gordonia phage Denise]QFP96649.1 hypothetical protein SEA_DENISE_33 [Gordonia phage Denise]